VASAAGVAEQEYHGGTDDHGDEDRERGAGPVHVRSGQVGGQLWAPCEAGVIRVLTQMYQGCEGLREAGVQDPASADQGGRVADQPVPDGRDHKQSDDDAEEKVLRGIVVGRGPVHVSTGGSR
jgi:hypothetical protein